MPMYLPCFLQASMASFKRAFTASLRSSNKCAINPESRSRPSVSWVKSFEPIEKPSKYCKNCSASKALAGSSHIMTTRRPFSPRFRPLASRSSITCLASPTVRTKGTMISTLVKSMSSRTFLNARHSSSKHSRNESEM